MSKVKKDYESVRKYTDAELLDLWKNKNRSQGELVKMLCSENKQIKTADAQQRIDRILCRYNFEQQNLPVPPMWQ